MLHAGRPSRPSRDARASGAGARTLRAWFESPELAERAHQALLQAGVEPEHLERTAAQGGVIVAARVPEAAWQAARRILLRAGGNALGPG
jgi:hypothetical protein